MALSILRLLGEDARKDRTHRVIVQVPVEVATYLINEKRVALRELEDRTNAEVLIVPNPHIETPEYSIRRVRDDEAALPENSGLSYRMPTAPESPEAAALRPKLPSAPAAAVAAILPTTPAPITVAPVREPVAVAPAQAPVAAAVAVGGGGEPGSFWGRVRRWLNGEPVAAAAPAPVATAAPAAAPRAGGRTSSGRQERGHGERGPRRGGSSRGPRRDAAGERSDRGERADRGDSPPRRREREPARDSGRDRSRGPASAPVAAAPPVAMPDSFTKQEPGNATALPEGAESQREPRAEGAQRSRRGGRRRRGRGGAGRSASALGGSPTQPEFDLDHSGQGNGSESPSGEAGGSGGGENFDAPAHAPREETSRDVDTARMEAPRFDQPSVSWSSAVPQGENPPAADRNE
jgi:ribonuclease E